jgi:hypothetical protein
VSNFASGESQRRYTRYRDSPYNVVANRS